MSLPELELGTAFALGLLGSTHCIFMCGGISAAMGLSLGTGASKAHRLLYLLLGSTGRIITYGSLGALLAAFAGLLDGYQTAMFGLRLLAGAMLILMGIYVAGIPTALVWLERAGAKLFAPMQRFAGASIAKPGVGHALIAGLAWGWLPCGLVYSTLVWAGSSADWRLGALRMIMFGAGTLPAILVTGLAANRATTLFSGKVLRRAVGVLIIVFGIWTMLAVMLHGGFFAGPGEQHIH